ncbi:ABC transporter ATP-binding protein [Leucobacter chinensis]|uniref:ABC transporter ATP-binding protein n=1 Tax=Leucobacter chinensis TaxID=2851010 RepID=UPI001C22BEF8|nr:ABC transporter ATP-binding protein [Leucobacter chinensis]
MIEMRDATLGYGSAIVCEELQLAVPEGSLTMIIGPNGCGKSTVLKALSRAIAPRVGQVVLDGADIRGLGTKQLAKRLGILSQHSRAPEGIRVAELVARGRYPHQRALQRWSEVDERAVAEAMDITGVAEFSGHAVDQLSGGQRQRVWIAMVLAQQTPLLLLDEPTTYLDLAHQLEILELCAALTAEQGRTVVAVMHDLSQAVRYATHLIAMRGGEIVSAGSPEAVVTPGLVREVFGVEASVMNDPATGLPVVVPVRTVGPGQRAVDSAATIRLSGGGR